MIGESERYLPKYLNAMPQILWWELDQFLVFIGFISVGILAGRTFSGFVAGMVATFAYTKIRDNRQPGYFKHWMYSKGLYNLKDKMPEYYVKEFIR